MAAVLDFGYPLTPTVTRIFLSGSYSAAAPVIAQASSTNSGLAFSNGSLFYSYLGTSKFSLSGSTSEFKLSNGLAFGWTPGNADATQCDTRMYRDEQGVVNLRNAANAHILRVSRTYTTESNYERAALQTGAGYVELAAETAGTGTDDLDVRLTPAGAGLVRFGTFAGDGTETPVGYLEVKDAAGNTRKLMVVT